MRNIIDVPWCIPKNGMEKALLKRRQSNPYTHQDKRQEGICYVCGVTDLVNPYIMIVCQKCWNKKSKRSILGFRPRIATDGVNVVPINGICGICNMFADPKKSYPLLTIDISVLRCQRCSDKHEREWILHPKEHETPTKRMMRSAHGQHSDDVEAITGGWSFDKLNSVY